MKNHYVSFTSADHARLAEEEIAPDSLAPGEAIVRGEFSIVSSGTEGATFTDLVAQMVNLQNLQRGWPRRTGYGHLGEVIATGPGTTNVKPGDRILTFSHHGSHTRANVGRFALPVRGEIPGRRAVATRMAGVAATALRSSSVQPGDRVVIIGLGLVGNFAAQLFQLAGARVLGLDIAEKRLATARACGIREVANPASGDPVALVRDWSGDGQGAEIVVEAIGVSPLVMQAVEMTRRHGEVLLLGSPRAHHTTDVTPMLTRIHLLAIRMIGALEWTYPIGDGTERARFTIERNYRQILEWIAAERLIVDPLISHVLSPRECQRAFDGLTREKDVYTAVVFDWSLL
ncbi:MAG: zinc-binding alcohol dehydrogenase [Chloroflexi bacterium]|nr:zinc-binding alcohol dehydrogenase [Chloroflexota bacterium]